MLQSGGAHSTGAAFTFGFFEDPQDGSSGNGSASSTVSSSSSSAPITSREASLCNSNTAEGYAAGERVWVMWEESSHRRLLVAREVNGSTLSVKPCQLGPVPPPDHASASTTVPLRGFVNHRHIVHVDTTWEAPAAHAVESVLSTDTSTPAAATPAPTPSARTSALAGGGAVAPTSATDTPHSSVSTTINTPSCPAKSSTTTQTNHNSGLPTHPSSHESVNEVGRTLWTPTPPPFTSSLHTLTWPLKPDAFVRECWGRRALCVQGTGERLSRLREVFDGFHVPRMLETASRVVVWMKTIRTKCARSEPGESSKTAESARMQYIDASADVALSCYRAGHSLYFNPSIALQEALLKTLTRDLGLGFGATLDGGVGGDVEVFAVRGRHVTPWHMDAQENFTVQLRGVKKWTIAPGVADPLTNYHPRSSNDGAKVNNRVLHRGYTQAPLPTRVFEDPQTVVLRPGSFLYVPAGMWHTVESLGDHEEGSLSVNFSVDGARWGDVLLRLLQPMLWSKEHARKRVRYGDARECIDGIMQALQGLKGGLDSVADSVKGGMPGAIMRRGHGGQRLVVEGWRWRMGIDDDGDDDGGRGDDDSDGGDADDDDDDDEGDFLIDHGHDDGDGGGGVGRGYVGKGAKRLRCLPTTTSMRRGSDKSARRAAEAQTRRGLQQCGLLTASAATTTTVTPPNIPPSTTFRRNALSVLVLHDHDEDNSSTDTSHTPLLHRPHKHHSHTPPPQSRAQHRRRRTASIHWAYERDGASGEVGLGGVEVRMELCASLVGVVGRLERLAPLESVTMKELVGVMRGQCGRGMCGDGVGVGAVGTNGGSGESGGGRVDARTLAVLENGGDDCTGALEMLLGILLYQRYLFIGSANNTTEAQVLV